MTSIPSCSEAKLPGHCLKALALAVALVASALLPTATSRADEPDHRDPAARLQLVIKSIHIFDDQDLGEGDINIDAYVWPDPDRPVCLPDGPSDPCVAPLARAKTISFHAGDGMTVPLNRTIPEDGGFMRDASVSPEIGFPVFAGERYAYAITGFDEDLISNDSLGTLRGEMNEQNDWSLGTWNERGSVPPGCTFLPPGCEFDRGGLPAHFSVEYQIRRVPLPDLIPINIRPTEVEGRQFFCVVLQNIGERAADAFQVTTRTDGTTLLSVAPVPGLGVNQTYEHCVSPQLPAGDHALSFTVDEAREVAEMNELNNIYLSKFNFRGAQGAGMPSVTIAEPGANAPLGPAQPDLLVSAIRIKGKNPDGNNDCDPGKNDVTVLVRNQGDRPAASFIVVLAVSDGQAENNLVQSVNALDAGTERDILFKDVELKKGERRLTATADAESKNAESREDNNTLPVTATCRDDDS